MEKCTIIASKRCTCYVNFTKPCSWFGPIEQFGDHLSDARQSQLLKMDSPIEFKFSDEAQKRQMYRFVYYDGEMFKSVVTVDAEKFKINVQKVSKLRKREYKFTVDFTINENNVLVMTKKCELDSMVINRTLMTSLINENKILFKLMITECH